MWTCPECGRGFRNRNQWHSCVARTVDSHFEGKPAGVRAVYDRLVERLRACEEIGDALRIDVVGAGINFAGRAHFAGCTAQQRALSVGVGLPRRLEHPRVAKIFAAGSQWWGHTVKLRSPNEVDDELLAWLREGWSVKGR